MKTKQMLLLLCAWVLWATSFSEKTNIEITTPEEGYESRKECLRDLNISSEANEKRKKKGEVSIGYRCLPDTIDPRGVKGGTP